MLREMKWSSRLAAFSLALAGLFAFWGPPWWLAFLPPLALVAVSLGTLGASLRSRSRAGVALSLAAASVCAMFCLDMRLGSPTGEEPGGTAFTAVTWNIDSWRSNLQTVTDELASDEADFIFLQEIHKGPPDNDPRKPVRSRLAAGRFWVQSVPWQSDLAMISRYPLRDTRELALGRGYGQQAVADTPVGPITLINLRLRRLPYWLPTLDDGEQWSVLLRHLDERGGPAIIAGDFNAPSCSAPIRELQGRMRDCFSVAGQGLGATFPSWLPLWRLDYVFVSEEFRVEAVRVSSGGGSDHRRVRVELTTN